MKKDTALVMSCHEHDVPGTWRINLKWQGNHDISDFDLDRLGAVLRSGAGTEHTGYMIVKSYAKPKHRRHNSFAITGGGLSGFKK
jgi:hypothetical protein